MYQIALESDAFGIETFAYNTRKEQRAGFARLRKSARQHQKRDGIKRKVYYKD